MNRAHRNHVRAVLLSLLSAPALLAGCTSTVDPLSAATIADLTTAQAETWCSTTYEGMFTKPTGEWTVQPDGMVVMGRGDGASGISLNKGGQFEFNDVENGPCFFQLPVDQCAANLKLHPCQATLQELDECLQSFDTGPPSLIKSRCGAFHSAPSCSETIVSATLPDTEPNSAVCELPVR